MAHFAEIDENDTVLRVLVVPDDQEHRGQDYLAVDLGLGGTWVQCSYTGSFGKNYPGPGWKYDRDFSGFDDPTPPWPSWVINRATGRWDSPVPRPQLPPEAPFMWAWDEDAGQWIKVHDPALGPNTQ